MSWNKELKLKQVDEMLDKLKSLQFSKPKSGWLKLIRSTLDMSARILGNRVGVSQSRVTLIEKGELNGTITLNTLNKVADGLGCEVVYFLVPKDGSLSKFREKHAYEKATMIDSYTELHMQLENQGTSNEFHKQTIEQIKSEYLKSWSSSFWDKS
jgi:XRE family transcriptional regulator, regulator of sulfur utilization